MPPQKILYLESIREDGCCRHPDEEMTTKSAGTAPPANPVGPSPVMTAGLTEGGSFLPFPPLRAFPWRAHGSSLDAVNWTGNLLQD